MQRISVLGRSSWYYNLIDHPYRGESPAPSREKYIHGSICVVNLGHYHLAAYNLWISFPDGVIMVCYRMASLLDDKSDSLDERYENRCGRR